MDFDSNVMVDLQKKNLLNNTMCNRYLLNLSINIKINICTGEYEN